MGWHKDRLMAQRVEAPKPKAKKKAPAKKKAAAKKKES